ncbi:MAG: glycosyltransferase family 39 protein [Phormidesmis sp.]
MTLKKLLIVGLLLIGLYARFANLDQKVYTVDEVRGLLRASGYAAEEPVDNLYTGELITNGQLQQYQTPTIEHSVGDALKAFANNPEHPPLYYLLMRFSLQIFHTPVASRWLAVILSLLLLPATYWLAQLLFAPAAVGADAVDPKTVGWSAIALIAVSPFHVLLAQEARQYSLWALLLVVSSAFLLQALKRNHWKQWLAYGATAILGIYSHLFFAWVLISHGLYVLVIEKFRLTQKLLRYIVISIGIIVAFLPWAWVIVSRHSQLEKTTKWASNYQTGILDRVEYWVHNLGIGFIDFDWPVSFLNPLSYLLLAGFLYSLYQLCRYTPKRVWLFVVLLMGISAFAQVAPDILNSGRRSLLPRYSLTVYLGIELVVAYAMALTIGPMASQLQSSQKVSQPQPAGLKVRQFSILALLLGGAVSSLLITQSLDWGKGSSTISLIASPQINQAEQPIVISDTEYFYLLSLSYYVSPNTRYLLLNREQPESYNAILAQLPSGSEFFVYSPSAVLAEAIESSKTLESDIVLPEAQSPETQADPKRGLYTVRRLPS